MKKLFRKTAIILIAAIILSALPICGHAEDNAAPPKSFFENGIRIEPKVTPPPAEETWAVYMYICGSDLESKYGSATDNLGSLKFKQMPENLKMVVETGGTHMWQNELMDPNYIQRWDVSPDGFTDVGDLPLSNMSEESTLEDFLQFCKYYCPADKTLLIIWDHGGGTCYGACNDENYSAYDTLSIREIHEAIENSFGTDENNPPLSLLAFDCCLMSTLDVAELFSDEASYLLASEELIPGGGFNYKSFFKLFRDNPAIEPEELGKGIVDGYSAKYLSRDTNETVTLSLTDLSKVHRVSSSVDAMFGDLLKTIYDDPDFFVDVSILAGSTENYGGNSRAQGYTNLVDIKDFASQFQDFIPSAREVMDAVDDAVVYETFGEYRAFSGGLSMFYNYNAAVNDMEMYYENGTSDALKSFFAITSFNVLPDSEKPFMDSIGLDSQALPAIKTFYSVDTSHTEIRKNSEGRYYVDFGPDVGTCATDAMFELYYIGEDDIYYLGSDDELNCDFSEGLFIDNFGGKWLRLGDWVASMELEVDTNGYNIYSLPILIDGEDYYMQVGYDFEEKVWEELGVRRVTSEPGTAMSFVLNEGTVFTVLQPVVCEGRLKYYQIAELEYNDNIWDYGDLPDGEYMMKFRLEDVHKNNLYSDAFIFRIVDRVPVYD